MSGAGWLGWCPSTITGCVRVRGGDVPGRLREPCRAGRGDGRALGTGAEVAARSRMLPVLLLARCRPDGADGVAPVVGARRGVRVVTRCCRRYGCGGARGRGVGRGRGAARDRKAGHGRGAAHARRSTRDREAAHARRATRDREATHARRAAHGHRTAHSHQAVEADRGQQRQGDGRQYRDDEPPGTSSAGGGAREVVHAPPLSSWCAGAGRARVPVRERANAGGDRTGFRVRSGRRGWRSG
ncbi:hypothetical protein SHJG_8530 [Streptomyces hygroscopicus subsp. jinggangensis 5008]|nr:hypothetical protein SHJG_8530 [Streptomyces hygroscopicus subsp. jinggangensis 5008]AGF67952.1 hypothetical protein SHJGH_8290 [Streptomyces hygroscopicus subsp. jinggangensis TL01]